MCVRVCVCVCVCACVCVYVYIKYLGGTHTSYFTFSYKSFLWEPPYTSIVTLFLNTCYIYLFPTGRKHKTQKFRDWVFSGVNLDIKPTQEVLEVIAYLAYETVAQVSKDL